MNLRPWNYWSRDGRPYAETPEIVRVLESVIARDPEHPGALHLYIHVMELPSPEKAEGAADRLLPLMPAAGHMVHMPAHIYIRVGRYADAVRANELAVAADEDYITQCRAQGIYPLGYYPHNIHFIWAAATLEGRSELALAAARKAASKFPVEKLKEFPLGQTLRVAPLYAMVRFGRWEEILREAEPPQEHPFLVGIWHYARGSAWAATGKPAEAAQELARLRAIAADDAMVAERPSFSDNSGAALLRVAAEALAGELAARQGEIEKAIAHLHRAVLLEDSLIYNEPPDWHYPVRQSLGAALLQAGHAAEAEAVYWEDLRRNPENGWSLFGLAQALRAQGKEEEAAQVEERFQRAWARADVKLAASRF